MRFIKPFHLYKGLPRELYFIFAAVIVTSLGNFVLPFLTLLLTDKLGYSAQQAGGIMLCTTLAYIPGSLISGKYCDTVGRKKILLFSQFCFACCYIFCGLLGVSPFTPYFIVAAQFFTGASYPVQQAFVTDMTHAGNRQAAFSLLYLAHNIGFAIGPVIAGFLYNRFMRLIFLGDAFTTLMALLLIAFFVKETIHLTKAEDAIENEEERAESKGVLHALLDRPLLVFFVFLCFIMNFIYAQHFFSLPIQLKQLFADEGARYFGFNMSLNAVLVILLTAFIVALFNKVRPVVNLCLTAALYAVGFGMITFSNILGLFFISTTIWTLGEILVETNENVYIANHTPKSHRGRFNALFRIFIGLGFAINPYVMGRFIEHYSIRAVWPLTFILSLAGLGGFLILFVLEKKRMVRLANPSPA
jgi:MFS family permease